MARGGLTVNVRIEGVRETLKAFKDLPKEASDSLRTRTLELSEDLAEKVRAAGHADSPQSSLVAATVRAKRDRVPVITAGGMKRVGSRKKPVHKILFGSEFGAKTLKQYRPHVGQGSYWFFKSVEDNQEMIDHAWNKVADDVIREFEKGG